MNPLLFLALSAIASADEAFPPVVQELSGGRINWTDLRLEVTARSDRTVGAWKDRRVQEQDAVDRLAPRIVALAERMPVTPDRTATDLMDSDPDLQRRLSASLSDWRIEETRYQASGGVEMDAVLDLRVWLRPALASLASGGDPPDLPEDATGLVIDARGLPFTPSVSPTVLSADDEAVLRAQLVAEGTLRARSPALYVLDPADPRAARRAGRQPLFAQATAVRGGALVLASATAALAAPELGDLVAAGRVVIVVDAP